MPGHVFGGQTVRARDPRGFRSGPSAIKAAFFVIAAAATMAMLSSPAHAISAGCANVNAGAFNVSTPTLPLAQSITGTFEAGERITILLPGSGTIDAEIRDNTAGVVILDSNTAPMPINVSYTIPATGPRSLIALFQIGVLTTVGGNFTVTCAPAGGRSSSDLAPAAKLLTEFVLGQILPDRAQTISDQVTARLLGGDAPPQFSANAGSMRMRMTLADAARMARAKGEGVRPVQRADADSARKAAGDGETAVLGTGGEKLAAAATTGRSLPTGRDDSRWNVWAAGTLVGLDVDRAGAAFDGRLYSVLAGVDVKLLDHLLVGLSGGWEHYDLDTSFNGGTFKGTGYTVGPYAGLKLAPFLTFDVWAGWTGVRYDIASRATGSLETGAFDANRWFVAGNITGQFQWGNLRLSPRAGVLYAQENQKSYASSLGTNVPAQTIELGKFTFGPEISYRIQVPEWRMTIEPYGFIRGEYDFARDGSTTLGTTVIRPQRWGARAGGGLLLSARDRFALRVGAAYDSIGRRDERVIRGEARLSIGF